MIKSKTSLAIISSILLVLISVAATYLGLVSLGYVHTSGIELQIQLKDALKVYDGTTLLASEYEIVYGSLDKGDQLVVQYTGGQTNVGASTSTANISVHDKDGYDVTKNYAISVKGGSLVVTARVLDIELNPNSKIYDGTPLSETTFNIVGGELVPGHKLVPSFTTETSSTTNSVAAAMTAKVYDGAGNDVTNNYITNIDGEGAQLTIDKRPLIVTSNSASKVFDGTELTNFDVTTEGLLAGHKFVINSGSAKSSITNVGTVDNILDGVEYDIIDKDGLSVKDEYVVAFQNIGKLTVTPLEIDVTTPSFEVDYKASEYEFTFDAESIFKAKDLEFIKSIGYTVSLREAVTETNAGDYKNNPVILIADKFGLEQSNIVLNVEKGIIKINKKQAVIYGQSISEVYSGEEFKTLEAPGNIDTEKSKGLYSGHVITALYSAYSKLTDVGSIENKIDNVFIIDENGADVSANYAVALVSGVIEVTKLDLTVSTQDISEVYGWTYAFTQHQNFSHDQAAFMAENNLEVLNEYEPEELVPSVGKYKNKAEIKVVNSKGYDVTENFNIHYNFGALEISPKAITINLPAIEKKFDGSNELELKQKAIENKNNFAEMLVSGHYLSLTKTIARIYDVNDNEIIFGDGLYTVDKSYFNIYDANGVVVNSNYDITINAAEYKISKATLNLKEMSFESTEYNTNGYTEYLASYANKVTISNSINPSHKVSVVLSFVDDSNIEADKSYEICAEKANIAVYDELDNEITEYYDIKDQIIVGNLHINKKVIKINTLDLSYEYLGMAVTLDNMHGLGLKNDHYFELATVEDGLLELIEPTLLPSHTEVGKWQNDIQLGLTDENYKNYEIEIVKRGYITITQKDVMITLPNIEKKFDGNNIFTLNQSDVTVDGIYETHNFVLINSSVSGFDAGDEPLTAGDGIYTITTASFNIVDANGNGVTSNYNITIKEGTCSVLSYKLELNKLTFDSVEYSADGYDVYLSSYANELKIINPINPTHKVSAKLTLANPNDLSAGKAHKVIATEISVSAENGDDVTSYYQIEESYEVGTLQVDKKVIVVTTADLSYEYFGQAVTLNNIDSINGISLEDYYVVADDYKDLISVTRLPSCVNVGTYKNDIELTVTDDNYEISIVGYGDITITQKAVTITLGDLSKKFDGTNIFNISVENVDVDGIIDSHRLVLKQTTVTALETAAELLDDDGTYTITESAFNIVDVNDSPVNSNYTFTIDSGKCSVESINLQLGKLVFDAKEYNEAGYDDYLETYASEVKIANSINPLYTVNVYLTLANPNDLSAGKSHKVIATEISVLDENGEDISKGYTISDSYEVGTLQVNKKVIDVTTADLTYEYIALAVTINNIDSINGISLEEYYSVATEYSDLITVTKLPSCINVGTYVNNVEFGVTDDNYEVKVVSYGDVTISAKDATITLGALSKKYDGTNIFNISAENVEVDGLVGFDRLVLKQTTVTANQEADELLKSAGTYTITESAFSIIDSNENVINTNYNFTISEGTCSIDSIKLNLNTLTFNSVEYNEAGYDDYLEAYSSQVKIVDSVNQAHRVEVVLTLANPNDLGAGKSHEVIATNISVFDENNDDITGLYEFESTIKVGTLTVTKKVIEVKTSNVEYNYFGQAVNESNIDETGLTLESYYEVADEYVDYIEVSKMPAYVNAGTYSNDIELSIISDYADNYEIKLIGNGTITISKIQIDAYFLDDMYLDCGEEIKISDNIVSYSDLYSIGVAGSGASLLVDGHKVTGLYLDKSITFKDILVGDAKLNIGKVIISDASGSDVTNNYIINTDMGVSNSIYYNDIEMTISGGVFETTYNGEDVFFDPENGYAIEYTTNFTKGYLNDVKFTFNCTFNTATAGTYPVDFEIKEAFYRGEDLMLSANFFNCNVVKPMTCIINKKPISLTAPSFSIEYGSDESLDLVENWLSENSDYISGTAQTPTKVGVYDSVINATFDPNYEVTFINGTITVLAKKVSVIAPSKVITYGDDFDAQELVDAWQTDYDFITTAKANDITGETTSGLHSLVKEITFDSNYEVTFINGTVTINKKKVTIIAPSKVITYGDDFDAQDVIDTWQTNYDFIVDAKANDITGETEVGSYSILKEITFDSNYEVTVLNGTVTINKKKVTITAPSKEITYGDNFDAQDVIDTWQTNYDFIVDAKANDITGETEVGSYSILKEITFDSNYEVTILNGTVTINKKKVTITAPSKAITYGDNFDAQDVIDTWQTNYDFIVDAKANDITGETEVGSYSIIKDITFDSNYEVTILNGTVTINKKKVTITAPSYSIEYEESFDAQDIIDDWKTDYDFIIDATAYDITGYSNVGSYSIVKDITFDSNYDVTFINGTVSITKKQVVLIAPSIVLEYSEDSSEYDLSEIFSWTSIYDAYFVSCTPADNLSGVGTYATIVQAELISDPNYDITFVNGTITIVEPAPVPGA